MDEQNKNYEQPTANRTATRIQRFKEKCKGTLKFSFIFFSAIHVATIVIAAVYFDDCPVEPGIPKYVLVMGILGVLSKLLTLFRDFLIKHISVSPILSFIGTAELVIFIVGSYYIYREYEPNYNLWSGHKYCNKTLYLFSFIYITIIYCLILLCILIVGSFILALVLLDKYGSKPGEDHEEDSAAIPLREVGEESKAKV